MYAQPQCVSVISQIADICSPVGAEHTHTILYSSTALQPAAHHVDIQPHRLCKAHKGAIQRPQGQAQDGHGGSQGRAFSMAQDGVTYLRGKGPDAVGR